MDFLKNIYTRAAKNNARIVLVDGLDPRTLIAAEKIKLSRIAQIILLGKKKELEKISYNNGCSLAGIEIIDPGQDPPLNQAISLLEKGTVDGIVCGVTQNKTEITKIFSGKKLVGISVLISKNPEIGEEGVVFLADTCVNPDPNAEELAKISEACAHLFLQLSGCEPRIALLSYSTKGDYNDKFTEKMIKAVSLVKKEKPELIIDGELQADTALLARAVSKKDPENILEGYANTLIFPDLNSANISLKLSQILGENIVLGPILYGISKPVICVSRSCISEEIVNTAALAAALVSHEKLST